MAEVFADPHVQARDVMVEVGGVRMQGPIARLSRTPARLRHPGRALGADNGATWRER
jgi:crotonobetainyl-CoA:carnitine CoA-transferase CaiB-like acyl-CoA transferase